MSPLITVLFSGAVSVGLLSASCIPDPIPVGPSLQSCFPCAVPVDLSSGACIPDPVPVSPLITVLFSWCRTCGPLVRCLYNRSCTGEPPHCSLVKLFSCCRTCVFLINFLYSRCCPGRPLIDRLFSLHWNQWIPHQTLVSHTLNQ